MISFLCFKSRLEPTGRKHAFQEKSRETLFSATNKEVGGHGYCVQLTEFIFVNLFIKMWSLDHRCEKNWGSFLEYRFLGPHSDLPIQMFWQWWFLCTPKLWKLLVSVFCQASYDIWIILYINYIQGEIVKLLSVGPKLYNNWIHFYLKIYLYPLPSHA